MCTYNYVFILGCKYCDVLWPVLVLVGVRVCVCMIKVLQILKLGGLL